MVLFFTIVKAQQQQQYHPVRITSEITLDGKLDEREWQLASPLTNFMQIGPTEGADPTEITEARMLYDDNYLYVGFHSFDSDPLKIVRFFMDRDFSLGNDDGISVQLDTYNDKSNGVMFVTNTLSARFDAEVSGNGEGFNENYNTFWDAKSVVDSTGYTTEFRIPFSSLRFEQKEKTVMGFRFARIIKRKNELITYPRCDITLNNQVTNASQEAELVFSDLKTKKPIYLTPYIIGDFRQVNNLNSSGTSYETTNGSFTRKYYVENETLDKILSNIGADLKYGITKNFTLNLTLNTDFAQAEADDRVINLSKYPVNLPEKRTFFLESQNYLNYSIGNSTQLFNSRTIGSENNIIVPIIGGLRITGKQNGWAVGALNLQTTDVKSDSIVAQNFTVARLRKYYGNFGSYFGGIATNRISTSSNSISNQTFAIDAIHHFNDKWVTGFGTGVTYDSNVNQAFDKNTFINLFAGKNVSEGYSYGFNFEQVGENFNPSMGFISEKDYGLISINAQKRERITNSKSFNFWSVNSIFEYRWKLQSQLTETKLFNLSANLSWNKGSQLNVSPYNYKEDFLFSNWKLDDHITVPAAYYHMNYSNASFYYDESKSFTAQVSGGYGDFYGGKIFSFTPTANYILNRYFRLSINYNFNQVNFPSNYSNNGDATYKSILVALKLNMTLSNKLSLNLLGQYDDISNSFGSNLRFRYNPREGTDLYVVYNTILNTDRLSPTPNLPLIDQQTILIKYSVTFGL
jgi:hypothetical protein